MHNIYTIREVSSDHNPVILRLGAEQNTVKTETNWHRLPREMQRCLSQITHITNPREIEEAVDRAQNDIQAAITSYTTEIEVPKGKSYHRELPQHIIQLIEDKNGARKRAQKNSTRE